MKNQYKSYQESVEFLESMQEKYPNLFRVQSIGTTYEGREIMLITISNDVSQADTKPALLYTGTIHAREWIGSELASKFVEYIANNHEFDPKLEQNLNSSTIYMVPILNPDGFEHSRKHFSFWRKNRRVNKDGSIGVDLNRNFSIGFKKQKDRSSNIYGGEEPFSEAETKAIKEFVDSHSNITIALDYHSQGNVFFPAHKFKHEAEIDGTDLNTLCANMSSEINKVTGRNYGIHRGKPPATLISGSGREYYYSKGILATVVEVGTKNIPDYMKSMSGLVNENLPALLKAYDEVINYSHLAPKRVDEFTIKSVKEDSAILIWKYELRDDIYFEVYRNKKDKEANTANNRVGTTTNNYFEDVELESSTNYFYTIRAVNKKTKIKSPFAPMVRVRTNLKSDEFFKVIFASKSETGYVAEFTGESNRSHFGNNSLFVGVSQSRGISNAVISFDLSLIPKDAIIKDAKVYIYPINRVSAKIERYGEWNVSIIDKSTFSDITDFKQIENATIIQSVGNAIKSQSLTQGIWNSWEFSSYECKLLESEVKDGKVHFRVDGPKELPYGEDSQMMQFDIGYGKYGGGIHYRPMIDIKYSIPSKKVTVIPSVVQSIDVGGVTQNLRSGFDRRGHKVYGYIEYDLSTLPSPETTVITRAYISLNNLNSYKKNRDIRYYLELVDVEDVTGYNDIQNREKIEYIGYEVSESDLSLKDKHYFMFDTLSKLLVEEAHTKQESMKFVLRATSPIDSVSNRLIKWSDKPKLVIEYIDKKKTSLEPAINLKVSIENSMIKINWDNPKDKDFVGAYVVRNSFHPPAHFMDGVKIYGGSDSYTYDNFGSLDKDKYYSVFIYDDVPNYSKPAVIKYNGK